MTLYLRNAWNPMSAPPVRVGLVRHLLRLAVALALLAPLGAYAHVLGQADAHSSMPHTLDCVPCVTCYVAPGFSLPTLDGPDKAHACAVTVDLVCGRNDTHTAYRLATASQRAPPLQVLYCRWLK